MSSFTSPLNSIKIASPCSADWNAMVGNERQRYCGQCKLNVYNLSGMTRKEAENLIMNSEGRLCARFYRRADGTILTKDCPVGWAAAKKRMSRVWTAVASVFITALSGMGIVALTRTDTSPPVMGDIEMIRHPGDVPLMGAVAPDFDIPEQDPAVMGKIKVIPEPKMGEITID